MAERAKPQDDRAPVDVLSAALLAVLVLFLLAGISAVGASALVVASEALRGKSWSDLAALVAVTWGVLAAFRGGAALIVAGFPQVPPLAGQVAAVGSRVVRVASTGGRARCFYPAEPGGDEARYLTDGRETSDSLASLVALRQVGLGFLLEHLAEARSGCADGARPIQAARLPVLIYSHGLGGNMDMACYTFRHLAAQGVVVLAVEHTDGSASRTLQEGLPLPFSPFLMPPGEQQSRRAFELLSALSSLPEELAALADQDAVFFGGHSYGGPSAILASLVAERRGTPVRGVILHDPAIALVGVTELPAVPVLTFTSDEYAANGVRAGLTLRCKGAMHGNFVDAPLWAPVWVMQVLSILIPAAGPVDPQALHSALAGAAARFMRHEAPGDAWEAILAEGQPFFEREFGTLSGGRSLS